MGRQKRITPCGKYKLRIRKNTTNEDLVNVQLEYLWNRESVRVQESIRVRLQDWDPKGNNGIGGLRPSYGPEYIRENKRLLKKVQTLDTQLREYNDKHPGQVTIAVIRDFVNAKPILNKDKGQDFCEFVEQRLKIRYETKKIGRSVYENGLSCMRMFRRFLKISKKGTYKSNSIYLGQVNQEIIYEFNKWRKDVNGNQDETINHGLTPIINACEYAANMGFIEHAVYYSIKELRTKSSYAADEDNEVIFLTKEQMNSILDFYEDDTEERRKEYIEMFLLAFHCCGLRVVDLMTIQWAHINWEKREMNKIQVKTKNRNIIPLDDDAITILKKWHEKRGNNKYVLDLISDDLVVSDRDKFYNARISATKCINQSLKVVGDRLEIPFPLTMHKSRHTFAVWALNQGTSISVISRLLGHESTAITEKVYAQFLTSTLAEEVEKLHFNFLPASMASTNAISTTHNS